MKTMVQIELERMQMYHKALAKFQVVNLKKDALMRAIADCRTALYAIVNYCPDISEVPSLEEEMDRITNAMNNGGLRIHA